MIQRSSFRIVKTVSVWAVVAWLLIFSVRDLHAQTLVTGRVFDPQYPGAVDHLMVVSRKTGIGVFGNANGTFAIRLSADDTLLVSVPGYQLERIPLPPGKDTVYLEIPIHRLERTLRPLEVRPQREPGEVKEDLERLPPPVSYELDGATDAISHPITYLYERFSRFERSRREVAKLEYEDRKRDLLKELFKIYVDHSIIDLKPEEFDDFVRYLNLPDEFVRNASQYDLVIAVKNRYQRWVQVHTLYRGH